MGLFAKKITIFSFLAILAAALTGCSSHTFVEGESLIVSTKDLPGYAEQSNVVVVDTRTPEEYAAGHVAGAVNIPTADIVINVPVKNMLTSQKKIEKVMGSNGMFGHQKVKVVDGGFDAIQTAGIQLSTDIEAPAEAVFTAKEPSANWLATMDEVRAQAENPDPHTILLDVRSFEEYAEVGKVPTSLIIPYETNFFSDGTFKTTQITRINYLEEKIYPEDEIILYCQTSMRAAPVFVQLYEAGYRNIRIYDGAYLEWSSNSDNPVEMPAGQSAPLKKNAS